MLDETLAAIRPLDDGAMAAARELHARLTKPAGSLGALEELSVRLAGLAGSCPPPLPESAAVAVFAADHGVHARQVTPWPQEVTAQMVANFLAGGAVVNAFARRVGASVTVVDVGVAAELAVPSTPAAQRAAAAPDRRSPGAEQLFGAPRLVNAKVRAGTRDMSVEPALTRDEVLDAIRTGISVAGQLAEGGAGVLVTGDMGIANTTAAAALTAVFTGADAGEVTGRGTGVDDAMLAHKTEVVRAAVARHRPDPRDALAVLAAFGGLEHAALAGFLLGGAARRVPVILDGVSACAAALAAARLAPHAVSAMIAGHLSAEPGAGLALRRLGLRPLVDLGLRLGEGTGALLAVPIVGAAVRVLHEVATFDSAAVATRESRPGGDAAGDAVEAAA